MRFPGKRRRADRERDKQHLAKQVEQVQAQWPRVRAAVEPLRRERELNGWTDTIANIFANPAPRRDNK